MPETRELLDAEEWAVYEAAPTRRQVPWLKMQQLLAAADLPDGQALLMDTWLQRCDAEADACARFRSTALPYNLTLLSTGFIQIWIMLLPIGYIQEGDWWTLFPYFWLALLLLACDELATQLEVRRQRRRRRRAAPRACLPGRAVRGALPPARVHCAPSCCPACAHGLPLPLPAAGPLYLPALPRHPDSASAGRAEVRVGGSAATDLCALLRGCGLYRLHHAHPLLLLPLGPCCRVIVDGIALQKIADRPKAAMGYVSDRQVDPDEIELPLLPKEAVTVAGLL